VAPHAPHRCGNQQPLSPPLHPAPPRNEQRQRLGHAAHRIEFDALVEGVDVLGEWALRNMRLRRIVGTMLTVVESPIFQKLWPLYWDEDERGAFAAHLSANPEEGDVIRGSGGLRKIRWSRPGTGKSGGVRVIYFARTELDELYLLTLFAKSEKESIPVAVLKEIRRALES
jgi:hypothetical protein